jgi:hypothetical protein
LCLKLTASPPNQRCQSPDQVAAEPEDTKQAQQGVVKHMGQPKIQSNLKGLNNPEFTSGQQGPDTCFRQKAGRPGSGRPETGRPGAGLPGAGRPKAGRSEAGRPEAGRPEPDQPDPQTGKQNFIKHENRCSGPLLAQGAYGPGVERSTQATQVSPVEKTI